MDELKLPKFKQNKFNSSMPVHKILGEVEDFLEDNKIPLKIFYGKFDSIQLKVCQRKSKYNKYYPKVITQAKTLLQSYISLEYSVVILTNKSQNIANAIVEHLFYGYNLIVIGRNSAKRIKNNSSNVVSRLKEYNLNIKDCVAYYGDSEEDVLLATKLGMKNFRLMHSCSDIQLESFSDSELGIGLSYITALIKVFNHLSSSSITNPKYIFRSVTQRIFTSSSALFAEIEKLKNNGKSDYPICNELYKNHGSKLQKLEDKRAIKKLYDLLSRLVKDLINNDIIHANGDSDLYAKYIISLIDDKKYLFELLSPQYLRSGAGVRLNNYDSAHRQQDYLWYLRNLITEAQRLYPKEVKDKELDMLADLQHMGAATCLLDFSRNFLVSLWFATQDFDKSEKKETGYLFCYDIVKDAIINDSIEITNKNSLFLKHIESALNLTKKSVKYNGDGTYKFLVWTPDNINNRIIRQDSVFLFGIEPFKLSDHNVLVIPIPYVWKKYIQVALKSFFGVSSESLYADVAGYATSNEKLQSMSIKTSYFNERFFLESMKNARMENFDLFQKGTGCLMKGEYEHALDYFLAFESVNRTIIRDIENCRYHTESGKQLSIQLNILCLELLYSKGFCNKHIDKHSEIAISAYDKSLALTKNLLAAYTENKPLYSQNYFKGAIYFSHEDFITYLSNKLYKILDSYIGLLIDVKYHNQAYACIDEISSTLREKRVHFSNMLLLQTAQNEIVALAHMSNNIDAIKQCTWKEISSTTNVSASIDCPFIELLNRFFKHLVNLSKEQDENQYQTCFDTFKTEYETIERNYFNCEANVCLNSCILGLDRNFTAWDLSDIQNAINEFGAERPKKRKTMLKMFSIVIEFQGLIDGGKIVEKY